MTGYGEAQESNPDLTLRIEVRSVNNRHLKVVVRGSEPYSQHEAEFEKLIRRTVKRGSVLIHVRATRTIPAAEIRLNTATIEAYLDQLEDACRSAARRELLPHLATGLLTLPGVTADRGGETSLTDDDWSLVERVLTAALEKLQASRRQEGRAMAEELTAVQNAMLADLAGVKELIPGVPANYRKRIVERIRQAVADAGIAVEPEHLIREVAIFADRTDVSEEVMRLAAHSEQFAELVKGGAADGAGRRLEFVVQEMGREINTLGSKAGDVGISRHVVEMKASLEKVRELIQNVE